MADAPQRVIVVHTLEHALVALETAQELNLPVTIQSPPDAIFYAGSLYFLHLFMQAQQAFPAVPTRFILDCADTGAEAVGALELGHRAIRSSAAEELRAKLRDIATGCGGELLEGPYEALDLLRLTDTKGACVQWFKERT